MARLVRVILPLALAIAGCSSEYPSRSQDIESTVDHTPGPPTQTVGATTSGPFASASSPTGQPTGALYVWNEGSEGNSEYGRLATDRFNIGVDGVHPQVETALGPDHAVALAFSRYSGQVAYLTQSDDLQLWIADSELLEVANAWTDSSNWMAGVPPDVLDISWGPADKSVIVSSPGANHLLVYSLSSREVLQWRGSCDQVAEAPRSAEPVLWCIPSDDQNGPYAFLDSTGDIQTSTSRPIEPTRVTDWVFSPDATRILIVDEDRSLMLVGGDSGVVDLPVTRGTTASEWEWPALSWSRDGRVILVFATPHVPGVCPPAASGPMGEVQERPCWLVLDAASGEILWFPGEALEHALGTTLDRVNMGYAASISPDGVSVALFMAELPIRWGIVAPMDGSPPIQVYGWLADVVSWQPAGD